MNMIRLITVILLSSLMTFSVEGQDNITKYEFTKGEALDILLLNLNPESDSLAKYYFKTAIPIAIKNGYKPNKGFAIKEAPLQGNYHPQNMVVASWPSEAVRKACLEELTAKVDNFHQLRREIWTHFNVTYYPLDKDLIFQVDNNKYNVVTAYWQKDDEKMRDFISVWNKGVTEYGGEVIIQLSNAKSTFGYVYTPQYLSITSWNSKTEFEAFRRFNLEMDQSGIEQVHQFRIQ